MGILFTVTLSNDTAEEGVAVVGRVASEVSADADVQAAFKSSNGLKSSLHFLTALVLCFFR